LLNTLNVHLPGTDGRVLVTRLDLEGIEASAGSACASGAVEPSPVLRALGRSPEEARAGLRLSFGPTTGDAELRHAAKIIAQTLGALRA
ncbi:MAG: cysteine desulfurase, partial [Myxococcota bacterium]